VQEYLHRLLFRAAVEIVGQRECLLDFRQPMHAGGEHNARERLYDLNAMHRSSGQNAITVKTPDIVLVFEAFGQERVNRFCASGIKCFRYCFF